MPLHVPLKGIMTFEHNTGNVGSQTPGTAVTTGAAGGTKGAVAELFSATQYDAHFVSIFACQYGLNTVASEACLDILVGAGAGIVKIPNLLAGYSGGEATVAGGAGKRWDFPLYIPAGTRIAAQAAGNRLSTAMQVMMFLYGWPEGPPFRTGTRVLTYGVAAVPDGTTVVAGATAAEGAWTQIAAATTEDHFAIVPSMQFLADINTLARFLQQDIGIGAAAAERDIGQYWWYTDANEKITGPLNSMPMFHDIPSGTRLATRMSSGGTVDAYSCALHCMCH